MFEIQVKRPYYVPKDFAHVDGNANALRQSYRTAYRRMQDRLIFPDLVFADCDEDSTP